MDVKTTEQRSKNMSAVRGSGNKTTEISFIKILKANQITGWRRNIKMYGNPDFVFPKKKILVFIDGCFWHGCKKHKPLPKSNRQFWSKKIARNIERDNEVNFHYRYSKWSVVRIWEHNLKNQKTINIKLQQLYPSK